MARLLLLILFDNRDQLKRDNLILAPDICEEISIAQVAYSIARALSFPAEQVCFDHAQADGQLRKRASNTRLRSLYPEFVFTPFNIGKYFQHDIAPYDLYYAYSY